MKPKLKPFKAWAVVEDDGGVPVQNGACAIYYPTRPTEWHPSHYVRVVVRSSEDDAAREAEIRRLRRALRFYASGSRSTVAQRCMGLMTTYEADCGLNARVALARKGGAK